MKIIALCLLMTGMVSFAKADTIVLKNGKKMVIAGSYEVKGQYVVFKGKSGDLNQLPLKIVDLEKSKAATAEAKAKAEADRIAREEAAKAKPDKKDMTMAQIAEFVEKKREPGKEPQGSVSIENENLGKFTENNPRPSNTEVPFKASYSEAVTVEGVKARNEKYGAGYNRLKGEVDRLDQEIRSTQRDLENASNISAFGGLAQGDADKVDDSEASSAHELMEGFEKKLKTLKEQREAKQKELDALEKEARKAGAKNYKRYKKSP